MELPELPESDKCFADDDAEAYTANQIRAYGQACALAAREQERERCAQICESVNNYDNPMTANDCADAIRATSDKAPPTRWGRWCWYRVGR